MNSTSESLLLRLKKANDYQAWSQFVEIYTPLIFFWARKTGLQTQDAADIVQDVLAIVFQKLPDFRYERSKSFRGWLRTITLNKHFEYCRMKSIHVVDVTQSALFNVAIEKAETIWDLNYQQALVSQALDRARNEFEPKTWKALREFVTTNRPANEIAAEVGISVWTIYAAKARLMVKLRRILDGLLD